MSTPPTATASRRCRSPPPTATPPIARALLKAGANPNAAGPDGETVLMTAARAGNADVVNALIDARRRTSTRPKPWQGQTALMWAAAENHGAAIKALADARRRPQRAIERAVVPRIPLRDQRHGGVPAAQRRMDRVDVRRAAERDGRGRRAGRRSRRSQRARRSRKARRRCRSRSSTSTTTSRTCCSRKAPIPNVADASGMTALYAAVDMRAPANMLTRPEPHAARPAGRARHRQIAARARRESEPPAEEADHRPTPEPRRRRPAHRRRDSRWRARPRRATCR